MIMNAVCLNLYESMKDDYGDLMQDAQAEEEEVKEEQKSTNPFLVKSVAKYERYDDPFHMKNKKQKRNFLLEAMKVTPPTNVVKTQTSDVTKKKNKNKRRTMTFDKKKLKKAKYHTSKKQRSIKSFF